jgi:hypothetical protein
LLFIKILSDLMPQAPLQPFSRVSHLFLPLLDSREQGGLLSLLVLGTDLAKIAPGLFQLGVILKLCPLLISQIAWASRVPPTALPRDGSHQFHIRVETTDNPDHIGVELQRMIVVEKGPGAGVLHDQHVLFLAHPPYRLHQPLTEQKEKKN